MTQVYQATQPKAPSKVTVRPEDIVPSHMPSIPVASAKDAAPRHKPIDILHKYRFWQPNAHMTTWALIIDLDSDTWLLPVMEFIQDHPALAPSWIIEKAENGHGQIAWIIEHVSHGPNSRYAPQNYARDVRRALTNAFDADPHFTNARCWNPCWEGWQKEQAGKVFWGRTAPRTLTEIMVPLANAGRWDTTNPLPYTPAKAGTRTTESLIGAQGRNDWIFHSTRLRHYGTVRQVAQDLNDQLADPLSVTELNGIIRSIEGWEAKHGSRAMTDTERAEHMQKQAARGAQGGSKNTDAQKAARQKGKDAAAVVRAAEATGRATQIRELHANGYTQKQIMEKLKTSRSTVARALKK